MAQAKRFAIFLPDMIGAGAQRVMLNLANGMAARNFAIDLVLVQAKGPYLEHVSKSVRIVDLKAPRVLASLPALVHYLRHERPWAMLSGLGSANCVALWARQLAGSNTRLVISEHNTLSIHAERPPNWRARQMPRLARYFYSWADAIIAVSKGVAEDLAAVARIPRQRIQVIYNPVITPEMRAKAALPLVHAWFQPDQPPVILGIGRLTQQKDFATLIEAFALVRSTRRVRLVILGDGEERQRLEALVQQLEIDHDVWMPGFVENPYAFMTQTDLFVLSSKWEGLPTVLIEALYCGSKLVATDCPSGPREILANGKYGKLVPVGDTAALAQAIEHTLLSEAPKPCSESWSAFELETVLDQYLQVLLDSH